MTYDEIITMISRARKIIEEAVAGCHYMKDKDADNAVVYRIAASELTQAGEMITQTLLQVSRIENPGTDLEALELSVRTYNILKRAGIDTIEQLVGRSQNELTRIRGMGYRGYSEIVERLEARGLSLRRY